MAVHTYDQERSPTSVRRGGELYDPLDNDSPSQVTWKLVGVSDGAKIIVFRNNEGGTAAFDKTFSTVRP